MKKRFLLLLLFAMFLLMPFSRSKAETIPIDLGEFYADLTVTVAADGASATMAEDPSLSTVLLSNDPFFGDPGIPVPPNLLTLNFDFEFTEGSNNDDEFYAKVFDGDSGSVLNEFFVDFSDGGTVSWDLSGIDPSITLLGLEFQLNSWDDLYDSTVNISNVYLETAPAPVPEPGTIFLVGTGLVGLMGAGKKKFLKRS